MIPKKLSKTVTSWHKTQVRNFKLIEKLINQIWNEPVAKRNVHFYNPQDVDVNWHIKMCEFHETEVVIKSPTTVDELLDSIYKE
jgi:hypothetical protein